MQATTNRQTSVRPEKDTGHQSHAPMIVFLLGIILAIITSAYFDRPYTTPELEAMAKPLLDEIRLAGISGIACDGGRVVGEGRVYAYKNDVDASTKISCPFTDLELNLDVKSGVSISKRRKMWTVSRSEVETLFQAEDKATRESEMLAFSDALHKNIPTLIEALKIEQRKADQEAAEKKKIVSSWKG